MANTIIFDIEIFQNVFLFCGRVLENRNLITVWGHEPEAIQKLRAVMNSGCTFVSFNGIKFDMPVISAFLAGKSQEVVKKISNAIIEHEMQPWDVERRFGIRIVKCDHIDLVEVAPNFVGLKTYGARMHMPWLKDLPFHHEATIQENQLEDVLRYCVNDLDTTEELFKRLEGPLKLRANMSKEYGIDMRSKSDTQMAEQAFIKRLGMSRNRPTVPSFVRYEVPKFISFETQHLKELADKIEQHVFHINPKTGHVILPAFLEKELVYLNGGKYQMGIGGIHSTHDKKVCYVATEDYIITDIDAASFYPSIMINSNMIPQNTGQKFIDEYRAIYHRRLEAKRNKDKATDAVLKISLNGTFGKTASRWSPLYSPDLMIAITMTGQLTLLNLIEKLENVGAVALSANTDGIAMGFPKNIEESVRKVVSDFSTLSGFEFEYTPYRVLAMKDVNNYIAVKTNREVKAKGLYAPLDLRKNPTAPVCASAVAQWLARGTRFEDTIKIAPFEDFISARNVTGGGMQGEEYLGKVVRWYSSTDRSLPPLTYRTNGNKVPKTDGVRACMVINKSAGHPPDLDYEWYRKEAVKIAINVGCEQYLTDEEIEAAAPSKKERKSRKKVKDE